VGDVKPSKRIAIALENIALQLRVANERHNTMPAVELGSCDSERTLAEVGLLKCTLRADHLGWHIGSTSGRRFTWHNNFEGPSGAGATAQVVEPEPAPCCICGREGNPYRACLKGPLTQEQWDKHADDVYDEHREYGTGKDTAWARALEKTNERFGPRPATPSQQEGEDR